MGYPAIRNTKGGRRQWKQPPQLVTAVAALVVFHLASYQQAYAGLVKPGEANKFSDLEIIVGNIIRAVVPIAGVVLFAMLVYGGMQYLSSGGNPESMQKAKSALTYAVVGVALLVVAWLALLFIQTFTGVRVTEFKVPTS